MNDYNECTGLPDVERIRMLLRPTPWYKRPTTATLFCVVAYLLAGGAIVALGIGLCRWIDSMNAHQTIVFLFTVGWTFVAAILALTVAHFIGRTDRRIKRSRHGSN